METINTTNQFKDIYELLTYHKTLVKSKADLWRKIGVIQTFSAIESADLVQQRLIFIEKFLEVFGITSSRKRETTSVSMLQNDIITIGEPEKEIILQHEEWVEIKRQEELIIDLKKEIRFHRNR